MGARVMVLSSTASYRSEDFLRAAARLGVTALLGSDRCHQVAEMFPREAFSSLALDFRHPAAAAAAIADDARAQPLDAIIATDETTAEIAARAAALLGLRGNAVDAAATARNKRLMREALQRASVPAPRFAVFDAADDPAAVAASLDFPVVVKPLLLSGSRGVIRADDAASFAAAWRRLAALLDTPALRAVEDRDGRRILVEAFIPGAEVALEGILRDGALTTLAVFDKPDPLDGPFFEETLYVTPSRHSPSLLAEIAATTERAARAIGLTTGPIHAELRLSPSGVIPLEVAARSIGGLCARTLRFGLGAASLEELVIAHALGRELPRLELTGAAGVMMIPIPAAGILSAVDGIDAARAVTHIEDVAVTVRAGETLVPLPEGASYLGFIFARAATPSLVEDSLRAAHRELRFTITPLLQKL
jgi:biotin carboxylase